MIVFPNCKINLGLHILHKRPDGYHNLETVFYPVVLQDALEVLNTPPGVDINSFSVSGYRLTVGNDDNLCYRACRLLQNDFPDLPRVRIHLHKVIPSGAGLGGGSADGAFMLMMLNQKFRLGISQKKLQDYALQLGSDCPFFIINQPCLATGRGEELEIVELNLSQYRILLIHPGIHISTAEAFAGIQPSAGKKSLKELIRLPIVQWKEALVNDFEPGIFEKYPAIKDIKQMMYQHGAVYASMTGSGAAVFGLFPKDFSPNLKLPGGYFIHYA